MCNISELNERLLDVLRLFFFFNWGRKTVLRGIFLSYSTNPLKHAPLISCQGYGGLYHQESPVSHPWSTLYFYIIHLLKIQIILILYSIWKRDKNITVNTSTADVIYSTPPLNYTRMVKASRTDCLLHLKFTVCPSGDLCSLFLYSYSHYSLPPNSQPCVFPHSFIFPVCVAL